MQLALALALSFVAAPHAPEEATHAEVQAGVRAYHEGRFPDALAAFDHAIEELELAPADHVVTLAMKARVHAVLEQPQEATATFRELLEVKADYPPPADEPPVIQQAFQAAQEAIAKDRERATRPARALTQDKPPAAVGAPMGPTTGMVVTPAEEPSILPWVFGAAGAVLTIGVITYFVVAGDDANPPAVDLVEIWNLP